MSLAWAACSPDLVTDRPEPEWLKWFAQGVENLANGCIREIDPSIPFDPLIGAFAESALACIRTFDSDGLWNATSQTARETAERWLRHQLAKVLQWCLYKDFDLFRRARGKADGSYAAFLTLAASREWTEAFVTKYAGTARPVGSVIMSWSKSVLLLLRRLHADRDAIATDLYVGPDVVLEAFDGFPADVHGGGQSVAVLRLRNGQRVVYKPTDQTLGSLWINATRVCFDTPDIAPGPLLRDGYGWWPFVPSADESLLGDEGLFMLGGRLALATALGSTDMHFENFLRTPDGIALVDHETVLSPRVAPQSRDWSRAQRAAFMDMADSVMTTGAMPRWSPGPNGVLWSADAFGWEVEADGSVFPFLVDPNGDSMIVSWDARLRQQSNEPIGGVARPHDARGARVLAEGFRHGWERVRESRGELEGLVRACGTATVRVVLRSTREYAELLGQASMPPYCHDVLDRSLLFERVRRALGAVPPSDARWAIADLEVVALVRGDIPHFSTTGHNLTVREAAEKARPVRIEGTAPVNRALQNLRRLNRQRRLRNDELITSALESSAWPEITVRQGRSRRCLNVRSGWSGRCVAAVQLFDQVRRRAYVDRRDGSIAVVAATLDASGRAQQLGVADPADTYSGLAGLGLLAGALATVRDGRRFRDTAVRVADTLGIALEAQVERGSANRCGAFSGPAAMAYALRVIGDLLGERLYADLARNALSTWAQLSGPPSDDFDVVSGAAGVCHVVAALREDRTTLGEQMEPLIYSRLEQLLNSARTEAGGVCVWPPTGRAIRTSGFAHGSAGIGAAIARVAGGGAGVEVREVMRGALLAELQAFDPEMMGWRRTDSKLTAGSGVAAGWCYGGAGMIVASHSFERQGFGEASVLADRGVESILGEEPAADGLCHGLAGSSAVLAWYGSIGADRKLADMAYERLGDLARRCQSAGEIGLEPTSSVVHSAGLMCGSTGIGLALISPEVDHVAARLLRIA